MKVEKLNKSTKDAANAFGKQKVNEDKGQTRSKRYTTYFNRIKRAIEKGDEETLQRTKEAIMYAPANELKNSEASELMGMIKNRTINAPHNKEVNEGIDGWDNRTGVIKRIDKYLYDNPEAIPPKGYIQPGSRAYDDAVSRYGDYVTTPFGNISTNDLMQYARDNKLLNEDYDTVTRYKVEYYAGDNDVRLETYIYANSKEEVRKQLVAKTKSEGIDHVIITAMIPEEVPASYRDYDLKEATQPSGNNESKHITEARRKASDPKQIEKAEKAMFNSLMNGASNTEWMISDAKMIYGLSYDEAMKAFKNAHNKFMLQKHTLEEDSDTYYVTIYEEDQRYNPEEGGYVSTGWSASKSKQFKDKESALKYQQEFIEGADILNVDEEDNIIHIKDGWGEEYLVAVEDSASRGKSHNPAKSWAEAELDDIEQPKKVFFDDNGNRVDRDPKEVEAERKELEDKFNLFKDEISKVNDVKSIMHIAYDKKFGKIRHRKHDEFWDTVADRISEIKKSMNESSNANENYWFEDDDNFFNKEELIEFGGEIVDHLNEIFDYKWELTGAYEDGKEIEIEVSSDDVGTYVHSVKVDFRKIKKPSDINKYIMAFVAKFSEQIRKDMKDMMLNESLGGKYAKKILEFAKRSLDNHYDITGILEIVLRYCPEDILRDAWYDKIRFLIDDTDDSDLLDDNDSKLIESASEDIPTETLAGPEEGPKAGLAELISMAIKDEWDAIETYNTLSITARAEGFEDIAAISDEIGTEENKHVGQLQAALKTISPNAEAINVGEEEGNNQLEG